jgi:RNA polymerase sigma-70 factor (ECF subfamily)
MHPEMDIVQNEVDRLYKSQFGKMLSALLRFSNDIDLESAEDIVQDSFSAALVSWEKDGMPVNPEAWLFKVSRNRALNKIKETKRFSNKMTELSVGPEEVVVHDTPLDDQQLILLFACAHPDLAPKVQVVITLKYVVNLKVEAIARILGLTIDGIDKMLLRARQKIRDERILFHEPSAAALKSRIASVHKILYLIFNEGYKSSWGKELIREELCEEALIMTRALCRSVIGTYESKALYALMLFNAARLKARFGDNGELLDLEEQDRTLWDRDLIRLAMANLTAAHSLEISSYYCEAAIAGLHCAAETFGATDWNTIIRIYKQLLAIQTNPFVELNYAIALYYGGYKEQALGILHELEKQAFLGQYYLLHASLGRIYAAEGNKDLARSYFRNTLELTNAPDEIAFVQRLINKVE